MSFIQENFMVDRGSFNGSVTPECFGIHRYKSKLDSFLEIESLDYFPVYCGFSKDSIKNGDYLYIQDNQENFRPYIIFLDEFGDITLESSYSNISVTGQVHGLDPIIVPTTNLTFFLRGGYVSLLLPSFLFNSTDVVDVATVLSIPTNLIPDDPITLFNDYIFITNDNAKNYGLMSIDS